MNKKGVYIRRDPATLRGRMRTFYKANPGEWLTLEDAALKFDCTAAQAARAIEGLAADGVVQRYSVYMAPEAAEVVA